MGRFCCILSVAAIFAFTPACVFADQTLTLSLETPSLSSSQTSQSATSTTAAKPISEKSSAQKTISIGRVGVVKVSEAYIYHSKSPKSKRYATISKDTPLAIVKEEGDWLGVLMENGIIGWVPVKNIAFTGYELVEDKTSVKRGAEISRSGHVLRGDITSHPIIRTAMSYHGVRYVYGGTNPSTGMDCSAFVRTVFREHGQGLPRTSREQARVGQTVPFDQLQPGDRLYFACKNHHIDHCGIYAGNGYFIHCNATKNGISFDSLSSDFYWRSLVIAKR